jgi:hypothetical protein
MTAATFVESVTLTGITCCKCGVRFAAPETWVSNRIQSHESFFCPNGHSQSFVGKTEAQKLREELDKAKRDLEYQRNARLSTERQLSAAKGEATKMKNRINKGVCPCCNRSFTNLRRHMATKHPEKAPAP